jgi:hypothetical protein
MKLSEAIRLGSTILTPQAGGQHFPEKQSGCALGMAAIARGCTFRTVPGPIIATERRTLGVEGVWGEWILSPVSRPCYCLWLRVPRKMRIKETIAHLFDHHVMLKKNWTLDRLVAWVETVEPKSAPNVEDIPTRAISPESLRMLARMRQIEQYFTSRRSHIEEPEEPEIWQSRVASFLANHAKQTGAGRASETSAAKKRNAYPPWIPTPGVIDGTGGTPAAPPLLRH